MKSALEHRLGEEGWTKLAEHCGRRVDALRLAREQSEYYRKREKAEHEMEGDFAHRLSANPDEVQTIFDTENTSALMIRSVHRFLHARIAKDFFGSDPWLSAQPEGPLDGPLAAKVQQHVTWKLRSSNWKASAKAAIGEALALGETFLKTTYRKEVDYAERTATILLRPKSEVGRRKAETSVEGAGDEERGEHPTPNVQHPTSNVLPITSDTPRLTSDRGDAAFEPVLDASGDFIFDTDESTEVEMQGAGGMPVNGLQFPGKLAADGQPVTLQEGDKFGEWLIEEETVNYQNVDTRPAYWKDVLFELNREKIAEGFVAHTYDQDLDELEYRFNPEGDNERVTEILDKLRGETSDPKAEAGKAREAQGEVEAPLEPDISTVKVTECYLPWRVMANKPSKVYVVLVGDQHELLWCDYLATISPRGQCPIEIAPFNRVPGRAYGRGLYEIYEMASTILDKCISGVIARNKQNANPTKIWNAHLTKEGEENPDLKHSIGQTYSTKDAGTRPDDILAYIGMPDLDSRTWNLVEFFMQLIQIESGVTNASQGDVSSLPSNATATGVNSMLESSSVLHHFVLEELRDALEPALRYAVELIYFNQDEDETFQYLEGDAQDVLQLADAMTLRQLTINVRILLQRAKRIELREAALAAIPHAQGFYTLLQSSPDAAKRLLPLYIQALRGMEIDSADRFFPSATEIDEMLAAPQNAAPAAPAPGGEPAPGDAAGMMAAETGGMAA